MDLAQKVRRRRTELGLSQIGLAQKAGMTQATLSRIESGTTRDPKRGQLEKLARSLEVSVDFLISGAIQLAFDDLLREREAQIVFAGYRVLSQRRKEQLAEFARFLQQQQESEPQPQGE